MASANLVYLLVAFGATWLGIFGYLFVLNRSADRLREELRGRAGWEGASGGDDARGQPAADA